MQVKTIRTVNVNGIVYPTGAYLEVSSVLATFLTGTTGQRSLKAVATPVDETTETHITVQE